MFLLKFVQQRTILLQDHAWFTVAHVPHIFDLSKFSVSSSRSCPCMRTLESTARFSIHSAVIIVCIVRSVLTTRHGKTSQTSRMISRPQCQTSVGMRYHAVAQQVSPLPNTYKYHLCYVIYIYYIFISH